MIPFSQTLRLWRVERGLTQAELARRSRVPRPNLCAMERGKREVSLRTLRALASALGIRPGVLADGVAPKLPGAGRPLTRAAMERIAEAIAAGRQLRAPHERLVAEQLRVVVRPRTLAARQDYRAIRETRRTTDIAWLRLKSWYPPEVIRSLIERISERQRLA